MELISKFLLEMYVNFTFIFGQAKSGYLMLDKIDSS